MIQTVEMAVAFLSSTGGNFEMNLGREVGDMQLADYVRNVLLNKDDLPSRTIIKNICLKHLASLLDLLVELTSDVFASVDPTYNADLSEGSQLSLDDNLANLELDVLLPTLRSFIISSLRTETIGAEVALKDSLSYCMVEDEFLIDLEWFEEWFPESVLMKEALATYKYLEE